MSFYLLRYELLLLIFVVLQLKGENFPREIFHHAFPSRKEVGLNIAFLNEQDFHQRFPLQYAEEVTSQSATPAKMEDQRLFRN